MVDRTGWVRTGPRSEEYPVVVELSIDMFVGTVDSNKVGIWTLDDFCWAGVPSSQAFGVGGTVIF